MKLTLIVDLDVHHSELRGRGSGSVSRVALLAR